MPYDPSITTKLSEGGISKVATQIKSLVQDPQAVFRRMIVLDVVYDPHIIDDNKVDYWRNVIKVTNIQYARMLPRNTVIAQVANIANTRITPIMFLFPFFPSHLALPCKPGEMVWAMFEDPNARVKEMGYWFCRITEPHFIDDVNHTHHPRQLDESLTSGAKKKMEGKYDPTYELRNGKTQKTKSGIVSVIKESRILETDDGEIFEKLVSETDASRVMNYESIPRFKKRPGDIALEGSNNALIVLGTDRVKKAGDYSNARSEANRGITPTITNDFIENAGCIDIVAGRGTTESTAGREAITKRILDGDILKIELDKTPENLISDEGDYDLTNDKSRILVSQRTLADTNFKINDYHEKKFSNKIVEDPSGDAAIVIKSDKVRIIARSDISFIVKNYVDSTNEIGKSFKEEESDETKWASITITRNGDVIFTPSQKGYIKLGGDDADKAILCTAKPAKTSEGTVTSLPIASTAGGFVGTNGGNVDKQAVGLSAAPDLGTFSKKVLIK